MPLTDQSSGIDAGKLLDRCMGNSTLVDKLLLAFSASLPIERELLNSAIVGEDMNAIARVAHKLKGTASNMCADLLAENARHLEDAARAASREKVAECWTILNEQIELVQNDVSLQGSNPS